MVIIENEIHKTTDENYFIWNPGHLVVTRYLVEKGANVEAKSSVQWTALHCSSEKGN